MRIVAIQIAAGLSSRMGGPNKLLQEIRYGKTLIQHTYGTLQGSSVDEVIVVTGRDASALAVEISRIPNPKSQITYNPNFELGMTTSIQAGLAEVKHADAVMICLSDMPKLTTRAYDDLIRFFQQKGGKDKIMAPFNGNIQGNPVIFGADYFAALVEHQEMKGCFRIVKENKANLIRFETTNEAYFFDIDTPETFKKYRESVN